MSKREKSPGKSYEELHLAPGWGRQMLQVPSSLLRIFKAQADKESFGGIKAFGAAGVAMLCGAPSHVQDALMEYFLVATRRDPNNVSADEAWACVERAIIAKLEADRPPAIDRIMDPELTPPPGQKLSDQQGRARKKGA